MNNNLTSLTPTQQQLVTNHIKYAMNIALKYRGIVPRGITIEDLQQESCLGLCEAALHYDPSTSTEFTTYAYTWCKKYILQAIRHNNHSLCSIADSITDHNITEEECFNGTSLSDLRFSLLNNLLSLLTPKERTIISLAYGIPDTEPLGFRQIADTMHIPCTHVKQLYTSALTKMQHQSPHTPVS